MSILTAGDVRAFFHERVTATVARHGLDLDDHTEFYLVNLLAEFVRAEQLYELGEDGTREDPPLAFLLKRALECPPGERVPWLKRLGDTSLFVSGFLSDSLSRSLVDVDYYIAMGGRAYGSAADLSGRLDRGRALSVVFEELADKFGRLVDCLMEISESAGATRDGDIVRLYERWLATGSERLAKKLTGAGILPGTPPKAGWVH